MSVVKQRTPRDLAALPADIRGIIARAALRAEGDDLRARDRLRSVNRTWHAALAGVPVVMMFKRKLNDEQKQRLLTTALSFRHLQFHLRDAATCIMLQNKAMLRRSRPTLEELHLVSSPKDGPLWADRSLSLARFGVLRSLTLVSFWLPRLPASLERLHIIAPRLGEAVSCLNKRRLDPPDWSMLHLTRLTELVMSGNGAGRVMSELLCARPKPVLPGTLRMLRHAKWDEMNWLIQLRTEPLAAATIPVLDVRGTTVWCSYLCKTIRDEMRLAAASADTAVLPISFRSLWLHVEYVHVPVAEHSGGAVLNSNEQVQDVDPAEELCRFLGLTPECYEEFRLFAGAKHPALTVSAGWKLAGNMYSTGDSVEVKYDSVQVLTLAMQRFADAHGLAVSL